MLSRKEAAEKFDFHITSEIIDFFKAAKKAEVRHNWHEPDEQELSVSVDGISFDNAGFAWEKHVVLYQGSEEIGRINLATLCAMAMKAIEE